MPRLPVCRHRGAEFAPGRWTCASPKLVIPGRIVTSEVCIEQCPYVDHELFPELDVTNLLDSTVCNRSSTAVAVRPDAVAIAMIAAPRVVRTVDQSIAELRRAGFVQPVHVFAEPRTGMRRRGGVVVHSSRKRLGMWKNWLRAAHWLLHETDRPFLLLCEDDIRLTPCSALGLQHAIDTLSHDTWGYASLYTPIHNVSQHACVVGWQTVISSRSYWGSLAYCFTRESLTELLACELIVNHGWDRGTDTVVSRAFAVMNRRCYFHVPSLCEHTGGGISSVGHANQIEMAAVGYRHDFNGYVSARG